MGKTRERFPRSNAGIDSTVRVAWLFTPEGWNARLGPGAPRAVPYLPSRAKFGQSERGERIEFEACNLLSGVLYGWSQLFEPEQCGDRAVRRRFLLRLLEDLRSEIGWPTLELLALDAAAVRRNDYGPHASVPMLMAGREICPESLRIHSELLTDLWLLLEESEDTDRVTVCQRIVESYDGIDLQALRAMKVSSAEQTAYIYGAALHLLGDHRVFKRYFRQSVQALVEHPTLMDRLWRIARGERLGLEELKVFDPPSPPETGSAFTEGS
jgi:hypothetical protein